MDEEDRRAEMGELNYDDYFDDHEGEAEASGVSLDRAEGIAEPPSHDNEHDGHFSIDDMIRAVSSKEGDKDEEENILEMLAKQAEEKCGPPTGDHTAKLVNCFLNKDYRRIVNGSLDDHSQGATMVNKLKEIAFPSNIPNIKINKVNDCVYKALTPSVKKESNDIQVIESALCKAITTQCRVFDKLTDMIPGASPAQNKAITDIMKTMSDSVEISVFARARLNDCRRDKILGSVNSTYRNLSLTTKPTGGWLFGTEMEAAMKEVESSNKLAQKLRQPSRSPFLGQGSRGRGFSRHRGSYRGRGNFRGSYRQSHNMATSSELPPPRKHPRLVD
jgi:hypothetical protein